MKFVVPSRQEVEYLRKADIIRVEWRDRNIIIDLYEKYPNAEVRLTNYPEDDEIDWVEIRNFNILGQGRFALGLSKPDDMNKARAENYRHYYLGPVRTFQELEDLRRGGVCGVYVDAPLFFQMEKVKSFGIPVYAVANRAISSSLFIRPDGVTGTYIRPEDIEVYEPYVESMEFEGNLQQQRALFRIYAEEHKWSGEIGLLVRDINYLGTNRMIPPIFAETRLQCGQKCTSGSACRICYRLLDLADPEKLKNYLESQEQS